MNPLPLTRPRRGRTPARTLPALLLAPLLAPLLTLVLALVLATVVTGPARASVPTCTGSQLHVTKGVLQGAAGSRYLTVRVTNTSSRDCSTMGHTRYRFRNADGPIGVKSGPNRPSGSAEPIVIRAGHTVRSILGWTDPGPTVPSQCQAQQATAFRLKIHDVGRYYRLPLSASVCTTWKYRPSGTRLGDAA